MRCMFPPCPSATTNDREPRSAPEKSIQQLGESVYAPDVCRGVTACLQSQGDMQQGEYILRICTVDSVIMEITGIR